LIVRQYDPTSGSIYIDGVNLKEWNLPALKAHLGWVPQEAFLFSDTITNNIAFGMDNTQSSEVVAAAQAAGVHENIVEFPKGYETRVGERGVTLSGGQKQRVSIARALIKKPEIMIFDDCLSAVDTETEEIILKNIKAATQGVSSLIIAHRISSVKHCDQIVCLEDGLVIEQGTAEELEQAGGHFAELVALQLDPSVEEN
jgi:ATP-binding cassette subfamily B protein